MKKIIITLFTLCPYSQLFSQKVNDSTRLTIIGTIHNGNRHFGYKTLYKKLTELKPDVVLIEQSEPFKEVFGLQTAAFLGIWHPGIEQRALQRYIKKRNNCIILPYDTLIPERKKYATSLAKNTNAIINQLATEANNQQMTKTDSLICASYIQKRNRWFEFISDTTLERINQNDVIAAMKELYETDTPPILQLVSKYIKDTALVNWWYNEQQFWLKRNTYMAKQIIHIIEKYKGKKILVLTGLAHTYFLYDFLYIKEKGYTLLKPNL